MIIYCRNFSTTLDYYPSFFYDFRMYSLEEYAEWNVLQQFLNSKKHLPFYNEREIWLASVGLNVGTEMNGKYHLLVRPVLVLRKLNRHQFIGLPLTTTPQSPAYAFPLGAIHFLSRESFCVYTQIKTYSVLRLQRRLGKIPEGLWHTIRNKSAEVLTSASGA